MKQDSINQQSRNGYVGEMAKSEEVGKRNVFNQDVGEDDSSTETREPEICKTPKAGTSMMMLEKNHGRPHKHKLAGYQSNASLDRSFTTAEDMSNAVVPDYNHHTSQINHLQMSGNEKSNEIMMKRSLDEDDGQANEKNSKFVRMDSEEGRLLGGYYTPGQKEKLINFMPAFWNIGNPVCPQEIIGIRKNTQFYPKNKGKARLPDERVSYLVVSFENRKTKNSPFIEYPLNRLGSLIKALHDLKEFATENGYYNEGQILKSQYPDNTVLTAKHTRDTILETLNNGF